jgi:hypothetical protein
LTNIGWNQGQRDKFAKVLTAAPVSAALGGRLAEEDNRVNQFVGALPGRSRQEFDLAPVLGRRNLRS